MDRITVIGVAIFSGSMITRIVAGLDSRSTVKPVVGKPLGENG